jgi:hypothetical protein
MSSPLNVLDYFSRCFGEDSMKLLNWLMIGGTRKEIIKPTIKNKMMKTINTEKDLGILIF